jgi:hypothetical protein
LIYKALFPITPTIEGDLSYNPSSAVANWEREGDLILDENIDCGTPDSFYNETMNMIDCGVI